MDCLIKIHWKHKLTGATCSTSYLTPSIVKGMLQAMIKANRIPIGFTTRTQPYKEIPNEYIRDSSNYDPFE